MDTPHTPTKAPLLLSTHARRFGISVASAVRRGYFGSGKDHRPLVTPTNRPGAWLVVTRCTRVPALVMDARALTRSEMTSILLPYVPEGTDSATMEGWMHRLEHEHFPPPLFKTIFTSASRKGDPVACKRVVQRISTPLDHKKAHKAKVLYSTNPFKERRSHTNTNTTFYGDATQPGCSISRQTLCVLAMGGKPAVLRTLLDLTIVPVLQEEEHAFFWSLFAGEHVLQTLGEHASSQHRVLERTAKLHAMRDATLLAACAA